MWFTRGLFCTTFFLTEGNSDQCVGVPEIPEFLRLKTKNAREIMETLDKVAEGKIKFPDGRPVETVGIDSWSIVWSVAQEVAAVSAEKRAAKYNKDVDSASMTQLDWVIAKRLPKRILNRLNGTTVKYFVLVAREKDLYEQKGTDLVKNGVTPDVIKGTEYEMNLVLHFGFEGDKWMYETTKVQGALSGIFPLHKKGYTFPMPEVIKYASSYTPDTVRGKDEEEIASEIVDAETKPRTYAELMEYAAAYGLNKETLGLIMRAAGFDRFKVENWDVMIETIRSHQDV